MSLLIKDYLFCTIFVSLAGLSAFVTAQSSEDCVPQDIEIGTAGNIKPEKSYRTKIEEELSGAHTCFCRVAMSQKFVIIS